MLPSLAIFTVKKVHRVGGSYYTYGGFGDYVKALLPHFSKVTLVCHIRDSATVAEGWYELRDPRLDYYSLPYYHNELFCLLWLPWMFLKSLAPARRADILNPRVPDYTGICGAFWGKVLGKPAFTSIVGDWHHGVSAQSTRLRGPMLWFMRLHLSLYSLAERAVCRRGLVFAQGEAIHGLYQRNPDCHLTVSSSIYAEQIVKTLPALPTQGPCRILVVCRLIGAKGVSDVIAALAVLAQPGAKREYLLELAGEGPMRPQLEAQVQALGLGDKVRFLGQLGRDEIFAAFDRAQIMCLASHSEATPKVLLEAMARGVPVVATRVGGIPSVVQHERTGLLAPVQDPPALAAAIARLAGDAELSARVRQNGLAMAHEHTIEAEWGRMMQAVRQQFPVLWAGEAKS